MEIAQKAAALVGAYSPQKWLDIQQNMYIPYNNDAQIIPEYGTMNGSVEISRRTWL